MTYSIVMLDWMAVGVGTLVETEHSIMICGEYVLNKSAMGYHVFSQPSFGNV